jgi:hypothetical protein
MASPIDKEYTMKQLTLLCLAIFSLGVHAESLKIKPGLWDVQHSMNVNGQQMPTTQDMMADVPPEMREKMKDMMAKNGAAMTDKGITVCITPEQIASGDLGQNNPDNKCKMSDKKQSGNKTTLKVHCDAPNKADGTTEVTRLSDTQWKSTTLLRTEQGEIKSNAEGKWLKSDCGNLKPGG